jgi:predicted DNA-binding protein
MENLRFGLIQLRVTLRERDRWRRCAEAEDLRLSELVREAVRAHVRDLERLDLARESLARESRPARTPPPVARTAHAE